MKDVIISPKTMTGVSIEMKTKYPHYSSNYDYTVKDHQ